MQTLSRRHVIATLTASSAMLCPALLNAAAPETLGWEGSPETDKPIGQVATFEVPAGEAVVDVSVLNPGKVAVISRPSDAAIWGRTNQVQYVGVLRRTDEQIAASDGAPYMVVNMACPHRGLAIGVTNDPSTPFACTNRGGRHASNFDVNGMGVAGASVGDPLMVPAHSMDGAVLTLA